MLCHVMDRTLTELILSFHDAVSHSVGEGTTVFEEMNLLHTEFIDLPNPPTHVHLDILTPLTNTYTAANMPSDSKT